MAIAVWGIDIGKAALKAARMQKVKEGLEITDIDFIEYDLSAEGGDAAGQAQNAVAQFLQRHAVKNERVFVALPGQQAFSRFIKLPPVEKKRIDEIIRYEAQQQIPFPIDDVLWGYQEVHGLDGAASAGEAQGAPAADKGHDHVDEIEVGIFAIKREIVMQHLAELSAVGLVVDGLTIAPLALYNFVHFEMSDHQQLVVVDIGAEHTDLVIVDGGRFWTRNLPAAGQDVTRALEEKFQIPREEAEKLKRNASKSKQAKKIFGVMEGVLKDMVGEIHRSVGFYKSQQHSAKFEDVVILGNGSKLSGLKNFFAAELRYNVHRLLKLTHFKVGGGVDLEQLKAQFPSFGIAFGLALQGLGDGAVHVNLVPREVARTKELGRKRPAFMVAVALGLIWVLAIYFLKAGAVGHLQGVLEEAEKAATYRNDERAYASKKDQHLPHEKVAKRLVGLAQKRNVILDVIEAVNRSLPKNGADVWKAPPTAPGGTPIANAQIAEQMQALEAGKVWVMNMTGHRVDTEITIDAGKDKPKEVRLETTYEFSLQAMVQARRDSMGASLTSSLEHVDNNVKEKLRETLGKLKLPLKHIGLTNEQNPWRYGLDPKIVQAPPGGGWGGAAPVQYLLFNVEFTMGEAAAP